MRTLTSVAIVIVTAALGLSCSRQGSAPAVPASTDAAPSAKATPGEKPLAELAVLYAGDAGSPRTESFRAFLAGHVRSVKVMNVLDLAKTDVAGMDVLIVDGMPMQHDGDDVKILPAPKGVTLDTLSVPTVLIGGMGGMVSDSLELKLSWRHG